MTLAWVSVQIGLPVEGVDQVLLNVEPGEEDVLHHQAAVERRGHVSRILRRCHDRREIALHVWTLHVQDLEDGLVALIPVGDDPVECLNVLPQLDAHLLHELHALWVRDVGIRIVERCLQ